MCILAFDWRPDTATPLRVWANRDEFLARPAASTAFWPEAPQLLAGRDLSAGGSWMGVTRDGRFAALTNFRDPARVAGTRSRGLLVSDFLQGGETPEAYARRIQSGAADFGGFSLLVGDSTTLWHAGSHVAAAAAVVPGWHGLSNALLDTPWPKVRQLVTAASSLPATADAEALLAPLADTRPADDAELPDTGVGLIMERLLSPVCIRTPAYATRNSTWLQIGRDEIIWEELEHQDGRRLSFRFPRQH